MARTQGRAPFGGAPRILAYALGATLGCLGVQPAEAGASEGNRDMDRALAQSNALEVGKVDVRAQAVPGSDYKRAVAVGVIDASPADVWAVIEDCGRYAKRMPRILESRVRQQTGNTRECEVKLDMPAPLSDATLVTRAVDDVKPGQRWQRSWTLIEGDFNTNSGSWTLVPHPGGRTLAVYEIFVEPKAAISPGLQKMVQKRTVPKLFARLAVLARAG